MFILIIFFYSGVFAWLNKSGTTPTSLNISLIPPMFIKNMSNLSWPSNTNYYDAYNLDEYFIDTAGFPLSYSHDTADNISTFIGPVVAETCQTENLTCGGVKYYCDPSHICHDSYDPIYLNYTTYCDDRINCSDTEFFCDNYRFCYNSSLNISGSHVSFVPDFDYIGTSSIVFTASNSVGSVSGNRVYLFVGSDIQPPQWSFPTISKTIIFQNDYISFKTIWTDKHQLKEYVFSINTGTGFVDYPSVNFSGTYNTSDFRMQIPTPAGFNVSWRFCAWDTTLNKNCTSNQSFMVSERPVPTSGPAPPSNETFNGTTNGTSPTSPPSGGNLNPGQGTGQGKNGVTGQVTSQANPASQRKKLINFTVEPVNFKISIKQGTSETRIIKITNIGNEALNISIDSKDITGFLSFSETNFNLLPNEIKKVTVDFTADKNTNPDEYFGDNHHQFH